MYHRSIGTMSIPDLNLVPADIVNKTQVHCSAKYQINPYKACSSENALTRTTDQSVMPSKPLPNNASHGFTYRFTHIHKYQQFWTEDILNTSNQTRKRVERDPTNDTRANYNKVEAHVKLLTKHCKADKWDMACKDIVQRNEDRKACRLLHTLSGEIPKQIVRRQPLICDRQQKEGIKVQRRRCKHCPTHCNLTRACMSE